VTSWTSRLDLVASLVEARHESTRLLDLILVAHGARISSPLFNDQVLMAVGRWFAHLQYRVFGVLCVMASRISS
jgi:hypothetical protein